ncbi:MAG TPA: ABC transporter permease [Gemmatimonadaceae bacterium]|nr:ABC transporter permease [Gemmatimonadaceae bacterium]
MTASLLGADGEAPRAGGHPARPSALRIFLALLHRDMRVARKELPYFLVRTILQPTLFLIVFGFLLPRMRFMSGAYTTTLLPGILAVSLTLSSIQSVALPMVQDFGWTREIEDRLLAPVPVSLVATEKVVSGIIQGLVAAAFVLPVARLIMGPIDGFTLTQAPLALLILVLGAATFSALGLLIGTAINPQQIGLMFSVIIAPMIFFGCAYYPWRGLSVVPAMQYAVLVNPLVYVAEGMRAALTPSVPHMPVSVVIVALVVLTAAFWTLGLRSFERRAVG